MWFTAAAALDAQRRVRPHVRETPLAAAAALSELTGARVFAKLENLQVTGSFKARGAFHKLLALDDGARRRGVVAASTGNHGAAVAHAMTVLGVEGVVFVPDGAAPAKVANIRRLGAEVRFFGDESAETEMHARAFAAEHGMTYVSPYNDPEVVLGQSTIGVEMLRVRPELAAIYASLGGGGMVGGIGAYAKASGSQAAIVAVSARNSKAMMESVAAGRVVETAHLPTLSDGTAGGVEPGAITLDLCRASVDEFIDVTEAEIGAAMRLFIESEHQLLEGAAGAAVAGLLRSGRRHAGQDVGVVICGANIDADRLRDALQ